MEIPTDTNFVASNLEHCISNPATHVVQNETKIFLKEVEVAPSRAKPSEQDVLPKHKQGASETSQQLCSHTTLCNPYSGYYGEIFYYLMLKSFPSGASESLKRMLKRSSQYYCVIDGGLHYGRKNPKKVVSEKEEQKKVLARAHIEEGTGVHRGTRKMYELINSTMFWRFLYVDIANYIKECKKCIDYSNENHEWVEANHEPVKPDWPKSPHIWEKIYLQILGPYPKTASRNEFVVTILDPVSHWIVAQPIAFDSSLSSQVSCLIFKTFCDFGFTKCTISSVPPQISSDILNKLKKYEDCLRKVTAALGVPVGAAQICNIVKCQDKVAECAWLSELFSAWVQDNPCTWDKDLDEFLFEFRALPKNGAPSPFRSMFNRRPVRWSEADKENILQQNPVPELPKRRKLQGSLMKCRHCDELFTSKMSFRIHQRKHTEEARRRGMMEGEEPFRPVEDHESINNDGDDDDGHRACRSANQNASTPVADNAVNVWKRLKKITNKGSRAQIGKPQLREEVQKQLRANAVAAVKNIILTTKDARKKRGKYHKYPQNVQDEMARYAILHGILKTTHHFSDQLGVRVSNSTVRNIVKLHSSFTPQLKEEIGRFAAGFGVEAASRHFSERLDREVRQGLVRKFKKLYVARISDCSIKLENSGHPSIVSSKQKNIFDEKLKEEIGKYACEAGIASTVKFFLEKHTLRLKESLVRRLRKQYLDRNKSHANGSNVPEVCQHKQNAITEETQRPYQGNENVLHAFYTDQVYQSAPYIQTNGNLLPPQNSALHFNTMNNTTNSAGFLSYQQVPSSTTSVIVNQDSISVPIFQQPEQMYSSVTHQGHIIHGSVIPVPTSLASVPHSHFHFQPPVVTNTTDTVRDSETSLQPEHQFQQVVSSSANTTEVTVATVHVVPSLTQKLQPQADCNSSPCSLQPQAVVINESQHPSTVESSYPGAVVQTVGDKITMLSTVDTGGASLVTDRDGTYALTTCIPTGEKSLYKPQTFHLPISRLDTVAMAVCRDDSQTMNDVIITIVPSSENEKTSCKDDASFQDCQKISNTTFLFEKDQQHVYQKHLSKEQSHVIPVQLQQIEHFPEGQSHKPKLHQEQPEEQQQEKHHHLSGPQVLHLQLPLLQEQEDKTLFRCKQQQELPQKTAYQQQQSHHLQQPLLVQQNDSPTLQNDQHRQILLLQPHLPQEQSQKQLSQQNQQHLQQMQQQLLHQSVQLQEPQAESVQHLKKQHFYHPQQQLLLLQPHLNQNQLQKLAHQQNQLQILQLQQTKELMQQQKSKLYEHQKLIQMQQLFNCEQKHTVNQQKQQQLLQSQQPLFQLHLQFDLEQQKSAHEQAQQHSHHSQLYLAQEQTHEGSQQQHKLEHLDQLQQEVLQLQQNFTQEQPQDSVEQQKHQQLPQLKHQEIQLQQQLDHEQRYKSAHQEQPQVLHLYQQLVPKQTQKPTHQEKLQHLHQSEHQVRQLQEQLVQDQEPVDEETQHHSHQTEHRILELQEQLVQEQVQKPKHKEKQQHSHQSQHQVQQLPQQLNNEQPHQPVDEEKQQHFQQSQHQVFLLQQHLIQKQPQKPTDQEKQQHLLWPQHRVDKLQQHLVQKESQKLAPRKKCQNQHNSEHQALNLQQHLDEEQPRESVKQEKQQYLHLPQHQLLQVQQHLVEEQPQVPACQEKQQNVYQSEHQVLQSQHLLVQEQQQQQMHQEKPHLNQSHHEELLQKQLASENVQEPAHQEKQQHLHHFHHKAFYHQKHLSQEQVQELTHQEKIQQVQPHLQQPHQMLHLGHASHHDQLKKQANQQLQLSHPNLFNPQQQDDRSKTHNTHQQSLQPQKQQSINLGKEQSLQGQKSYPSSHKKRQLEVLPHVKVTCSFEDEESTDEPDKMVIYVADASDITHETTAKEQKKNSSGNSRKENNRNKSKAGDSSSHKRGNYMLYSPELRAELGRYAAEYGNQRAREYFKDILGHEVPESTLRSLRDKYILKCHLNSNAPDGINSVTSLGYSPRGRPLRLGKYDDIVRECIQDLMQSGEKVSKFLAIATAKQVLTQYEPELLVENGGNVKLTGAWAKSFLRRIGVQHDC